MTNEEEKILYNVKKIYKTKTAADLHEIMARLTKRIKMESIKESNNRLKYKSPFSDES